MQLRKVYPGERFSLRTRVPNAELRLLGDKYYTCPHCGRRTLIRDTARSPVQPGYFRMSRERPVFDRATREAFDRLGTRESFPVGADRTLEAYDFHCRGCGRPVRLLYEEFERAMGSEISAVVYRIVERAD